MIQAAKIYNGIIDDIAKLIFENKEEKVINLMGGNAGISMFLLTWKFRN